MGITSKVRRALVGTPLEGIARRIYTRLNPSQGARYDREMAQIMRRALRPDSNCVDVGAYRGAVLEEIVRLAPRGAHLAFEPVPEQYRYLAQRFPQVQVRQIALSDAAGETTFYHVRSRPTYSGLRKVQYPSADEQVEPITVATGRLDDLVPPERPIQFIKVDVEGAEHQVLSGARETIRRWRPLIVFEHGLTSPWYYGVGSEAVYDLLAECELQVSLMSALLAGGPPLRRDEFAAHVEGRRHYYFVAHPPRMATSETTGL